MPPPAPPGRRYLVVAVTAVAALWMYIDRVCFSTLAKDIGLELGVPDDDMKWALGAFFFSYALFQIPMGGLADRYGPRLVIAFSIVAWSLCTASTAFVGTAAGLWAVRLALGASEAGAYPAAAALVRNWAGPGERGRLSGFVALGGRLGGAVAPWLTGVLAVGLVGWTVFGLADPAAPTNWRGVFLVYGLSGLGVALLFLMVVQDRPAGGEGVARPSDRVDWKTQLVAVARERRLWLFGAVQFGHNLGWVFLITLFPTYLSDVFAVPLETRGTMQSVPLFASCAGMFLGGFVTDALVRSLGLRWGRAVPIGGALFGCAALAATCPFLGDPWLVTATLAVMALLADIALPAVWAFAQDVGGRGAGAALGWGNMWGNFGAALSPVLMTAAKERYGWDAAFVLAAGAFVAAGCLGMRLDARRAVGQADDFPPASRNA